MARSKAAAITGGLGGLGLLSGRWLLGRAGATCVALLSRSGRVAGVASQAAFAAIASSAGCVSARMLDASMPEGTADLMSSLAQDTGELRSTCQACCFANIVITFQLKLQRSTFAVSCLFYKKMMVQNLFDTVMQTCILGPEPNSARTHEGPVVSLRAFSQPAQKNIAVPTCFSTSAIPSKL